MNDNDQFKQWFKMHLKEELQDIHFSQSAREKVYKTIASKPSWWNGFVSLPRAVVSFALAGFMLISGIYFSLFFYVSSAQIAELNTQQKIVVQQNNIPFGAIKVQVSTLLTQGKGVGKP